MKQSGIESAVAAIYPEREKYENTKTQ